MTKIEIKPCFLGMNSYKILTVFSTSEKNELFCGKTGKASQLSPSQRCNKHLFLIAAEDHDLLRRCENFIECKIVGEEGSKTQKTEIIVETTKDFEDKSHLLIARSLSGILDDVV